MQSGLHCEVLQNQVQTLYFPSLPRMSEFLNDSHAAKLEHHQDADAADQAQNPHRTISNMSHCRVRACS